MLRQVAKLKLPVMSAESRQNSMKVGPKYHLKKQIQFNPLGSSHPAAKDTETGIVMWL